MSSFNNYSSPLILAVDSESNTFIFNRAERAWKLLIAWVIDEYNNCDDFTFFIKEKFPEQIQLFVDYIITEGLLDVASYKISFPVQINSNYNFIPKANPPERTSAGRELINLGLDEFSEILFSAHISAEDKYYKILVRANDEYYEVSSRQKPVPSIEIAQAHQRYFDHLQPIVSNRMQVERLSHEALYLARDIKNSHTEQDIAHFLNQTEELESEYNTLINLINNYKIPLSLIAPYIFRISTEKRVEAYKNFINKKAEYFEVKANEIILSKIEELVEVTKELISLYNEARIKGILLPVFSSDNQFSEQWYIQLTTAIDTLRSFKNRFSSSSIGQYEKKFLERFRYHWMSPKTLKHDFVEKPIIASVRVSVVIIFIIGILLSVSSGMHYINMNEISNRSTPISKEEKFASAGQEPVLQNSFENSGSTLFRAPVLYIHSDKIELKNKEFSTKWLENLKVSNLLSAEGYIPGPFPMLFYDRHYTDHATGERRLVPLQVFNEDEIDLPLGVSQSLEIEKKDLSSLSTLPKGSFLFLGSSLPNVIGGALEKNLDQSKTLPTLSNTSACMVFTESNNPIVSAFLRSYKDLEEYHYSSLDVTIETELQLLFAVTHIAVYWPDLYSYAFNHTELFELIPEKTNNDELPYHEVTKHIGGQYDSNDGKLVVRFLSNSTIAGTAIHEFGHMYHHRFLSEKYEDALQGHYDELVERKSNTFITEYSKTNFHEFFAENFEAFTLNPGELKRTDEYLYGIFQDLSQEVQKKVYIKDVQS